MNLEGSAAALLEQFPDGTRSDLQRQERNLERFGTFAFRGLGVVGGIGIIAMIYVIVTKMVLSGTQPLGGILFATFLLFAAMMLTYVIWLESLKDKRKKLGTATEAQLNLPSETAKLLDRSTNEPVPSVVEGTTDLLTVESRIKDQR